MIKLKHIQLKKNNILLCILLIAISTFTINCHHNQNDDTKIIKNEKLVKSYHDSIQIKLITKNEYFKYKNNYHNPYDFNITDNKAGILKIKLLNNTELTFKDTLADTDDIEQIKYSLIHYFEDLGFYLIHLQYYETGEYMFINDSIGSITKIPDLPIFSPNKKYFVTCVNSEGYDLIESGIQIWYIHNKSLKIIWKYQSDAWGPTDPFWKNDSTIYFIKKSYEFETEHLEKLSYASVISIK